MELEKETVANALQREAARRRASCYELFWPQLYCACALRTNCYVPASNQNSDITVKSKDPDFLKESNNLSIIRRFYATTLTVYRLTLNVSSTSAVTRPKIEPNLSEIEQSAVELLLI